MPTIIDELIAVFRIDTKQSAKDAQTAQAQVNKVTAATQKTTKVSAADSERIEKSQEVSREKRRKERDRKEKEEARDRKKRTDEAKSGLESLGRTAAGALIGFEGLKGLINFVGAISTQTAALGRNAANIGTSVGNLNAVGNSVELIGGNADAAKASFQGLASQITAFKTRGEVGPLLALASNAGVYPRDASGAFKDPTQLLPQIIDGLKKQGFSRPDIYNLGAGAGIDDGLLNLYLDPDRARLLERGRANVFADEERARRHQKAAENLTNIKQGFKKGTADFVDEALTDPLRAYKDAVLAPIVGPARLIGAAGGAAADWLRNSAPASIGVASNNPGNIRGKDGNFIRYGSMQEGLNAMRADIDYKIDRRGLDTPEGIINRYAPAGDKNNVKAYLDEIKSRTGIGASDHISAEQRASVVDAMVHHEQGTRGYAQVQRALATPGADTSVGGDTNHTTTVQIDKVDVVTQATNADGVARDFFGAMQRKGVLASQTNQGMTP